MGTIACPKCGWIHVTGDAVALSKFSGVTGYRTADGVIHESRAEAQEHLCQQRRATQEAPDA